MKLKVEFLDMLDQVARTKNIDREVLLRAIEAALSSASKRSHLGVEEMDIRLKETEEGIEIVRVRSVVEEVENPGIQLSLEEAKKIHSDLEVGDYLEYDVDPETFGRNAAQIAKQVVIQRIREAEREIIFEEYQDRVGELVHGIIQHENKGTLIVNLGKTEGIIPYKERMHNEDYRIGQRIRTMIVKVRMTNRGPQIVLSRTHPDLVKRLFEMEVPEIYDGIVQIVATAREPGERTKIAVYSSDVNIDPVGTCVGMRGYRVQSVVRELGGEKIDIIEWSDDVRKMVTSALSPAKIDRVSIDEESEGVEVVVPDDQLSLAIGKRGQNVRLAARLLGCRIDIHSSSEVEQQKVASEVLWEKMVDLLLRLPGVGEVIAEEILDLGFDSIQALAEAEPEELLEIKGVGPKTAEKIITSAGKLAGEIDQQAFEEEIKREAAERLAEKVYEKKIDDIFVDEPAEATSAEPEVVEGEGMENGFELFVGEDEEGKGEASLKDEGAAPAEVNEVKDNAEVRTEEETPEVESGVSAEKDDEAKSDEE